MVAAGTATTVMFCEGGPHPLRPPAPCLRTNGDLHAAFPRYVALAAGKSRQRSARQRDNEPSLSLCSVVLPAPLCS